jgi:hypothetical protein
VRRCAGPCSSPRALAAAHTFRRWSSQRSCRTA